MLSEVKQIFIVWSQELFIVEMSGWPLIKIELIIENLWIQKFFHFNTFFKQCGEIFNKEKTADKIVLVCNNIFQNALDCSNLIVS